jgi:glycine/D-amino acid oxidase-like deaminating enzyme
VRRSSGRSSPIADVVVIGGGILGATAALHPAEAGAEVVLVVMRHPPEAGVAAAPFGIELP